MGKVNVELGATWEALAHKVLASVLIDNGAVFPVMDVLGEGLHWFPRRAAGVWRGVVQCVKESTPPTVEAVALRGGVGAGYVQTIANQWTDEDNARVVYNAEELRRLGALHQVRQIGRELQEFTDPAAVLVAIETAENRLDGLLTETTPNDTSAPAADSEAWVRVAALDTDAAIPTGLGWFDKLTGGMWQGMNYWVAAPYKAGKTTTMRNVLLAVLDSGHSADVFCAEGSRYLFALDCQAMIATRLLITDYGRWLKRLRLSGLFIYRAWNSSDLDDEERAAIERAREIWRGYNVRVYDSSDGIKSLAVLRHTVRKDRLNHGVEAVFADYSQLFGESGTIYERQSQTANVVQDIAAKEDVAFWMLAQKNEAGIRSPGEYSAGVKGGGDAAAAADFLFTPTIDQEIPVIMHLGLKFSRHTNTGAGDHKINPSSGLIVDRWESQQVPPPLNTGGW